MEEIDKDITIFWKADLGSKAWGYDSPKSDNDIYFLYTKAKNDYVSIFDQKGHIGPIKYSDAEEVTGWDIKKYLNLLYKSNAQSYEIMFSPKLYMETDIGRELRNFSLTHLDETKSSVAWHYYGLARRTFQERIRNVGEQVMTKKYLYVLRPLFHCLEMSKTNNLPGLRFPDTLNGLKDDIPSDLYDMTTLMLERKRAGELGVDIREDKISALDKHINTYLDAVKSSLEAKTLVSDSEKRSFSDRDFDEMFMKVIDSH